MTTPRLRTPRAGFLLAGLLLIGANLRPAITSVGPVLGDIQDDLALSGALASALISLPLLAFAAISPIAPLLSAKFGIERTLGGALLLLCLSIVLRSVPGPGFIWAGTAGLGIAIAILNVVLPALVKRDFPDRVGTVTGWYSAIQSAVAALASGIAVPIAGIAPGGWRMALGIWAGIALVGFAVFLPRVLAARPVVPARAHDDPAPVFRSPWGSALAWQVTLFMGLQSTLFYVIITWLPSIEADAGTPASTAGAHLLLLQLIGLCGNITMAALIQRRRSQSLPAIAASIFPAAGVLGILLAPEWTGLWAALIGAGSGSSIVLALSLFSLRSADHGQAAALSGMAQSVGYILAAAGPVLMGLLRDATGSWTAPLTVLLGLLAVQAVAGGLAGRDRTLETVSPRRLSPAATR